MRWTDLYFGLMAAVLGFAGVVLWRAGFGWEAESGVVALAVASLAAMAWRALREPRVLLVGRQAGGRPYRLEEALDGAGYGVRACPGPAARPCPALHGGPCPIGGHPAAAVIYEPAGFAGPVPPCGEALGIPELTVAEASVGETWIGGGRGRVDGSDGSPAVIRALGALLAQPRA